MATVVNNPGVTTSDSGTSFGMIMGLLLLAAVIILFFIFGLPILRQTVSNPSVVTPQVNVPGKVDVNVNQKK